MNTLGLMSSRVVLADGVRPATIWIEADRIVEVAEGRARDARDLGNLVIFPGLVDCHVHVNEPGRTEWEGFETATRAAVAGGVTTLVDMPLNSLPVTTTRHAMELKREACAGKCYADVGFWGGVVPGNTEDLPGLAAAGVLGCKAFLVHSGIDEFPNATEADLRLAMPVLAKLGLPLLAHAELDLGAAVAADNDPRTYESYLRSRPPEWEDAAIRLLVQLCRETGCAVHIVHLSSAGSLPTLRAARAEGLPITVETCPHYLCLEAELIADGATHYKCAPPIRGHENREALWRGLLEGVIDFVVTDHSPCIPALKGFELGDFHRAWGGVASLQLGLSTIWTEASARGVELTQLARWLSSAPAAFAGLGHKKGRIAAGFDADLVIWDPGVERVVNAQDLFYRHKLSPYVGRELKGEVLETWLRGRLVFDRHGHRGATGQLLLRRGEAA